MSKLTSSSNTLASLYQDIRNFFDLWNILGAILISILVAFFYVQGFNSRNILVAVTAVYAFITFNQMRESRWSRKHPGALTVRPHFRWDEEKGKHIFGLKNFSSSPALNLRLYAILRDEAGRIETLQVSSKDKHLHLEKGSFLSLMRDSFEYLSDAEADIYKGDQEKHIELYYTFESNSGREYPLSWNNPTEMEWEKVIEKAESPREVKLSEIQDKCASHEKKAERMIQQIN